MIAIIQYNAGNIRSVENALHRLGYDCLVTDHLNEIKAADKVIFPGVGEAGSAMNYLKEKGLDQLIKSLKQPVLGICLGQQLLCKHSSEADTECLGIFHSEVKKFPPLELVPHMGWNNLSNYKGELFKDIRESDNFYFVHSYYCELSKETAAVCDYILPFSAAMQKDNFYGTQFHPEKSDSAGEQVLRNFLAL
jgi:glutamine amidotransferase